MRPSRKHGVVRQAVPPFQLELQALSLSLPDGSPLLYPSDLKLDTRIVALVGSNGAGKSTLCRVLAGVSDSEAGTVVRHCQAALVAPATLAVQQGAIADWLGGDDDSPSLAAWLHRLDVGHLDHGRLLRSLSGGERCRLALARGLASGADYLILDEPAAHLDRDGRVLLVECLRRRRGGALLVSHDRELLASAQRVVEIASQRLHDYALDFEAYLTARAAEQSAALRAVIAARRREDQVRERAQLAHERAERRAAAGRRGRRRRDQGAMYYDFLQGRAESAGRRREQAERVRVCAATLALEAARDRMRLEVGFDLRLQGSGPASGRRLLEARGLRMEAGARRLLDGLSLHVRGPERIGLVGRNGSGKSRLLRWLAGIECGGDGEVWRADVSHAWLDQWATLPLPVDSVFDNLRAAQPALHETTVRERLAWFEFRGEHVWHRASTLSDGERWRLALACELGGNELPQLMFLDEPDNHLDWESLKVVEHALRQYPGAMLVASHSRAFLEAIGIERVIDLDAPTK